MKSITEIFPRASKSFVDANPHVSARLSALVDKKPVQPIVATKRGIMNKTEQAYADILEAMKRKGEILRYRFESVKIRVGEGCFYVPDFFVERPEKKPLFIEVKGFLRDDARVKFLASKDQHEWADFEMWRKDIKTGWTRII